MEKYNKKILEIKVIKKNPGDVVILHPNHSIITFPLLFENQLAKELIRAVKSIKKIIFGN